MLYPDGELIPRHSEDANISAPLYIDLLGEIISRVVQISFARRLRILEAGAGNGELTSVLVESLKGFNVEYYATDIGKSFVMKLEKEAARRGIDFMKFGVLDISRAGPNKDMKNTVSI